MLDDLLGVMGIATLHPSYEIQLNNRWVGTFS
jgi:hypothetical protein